MRFLILFAFVLLLQGCATTDSKWLANEGGQEIEIVQGRMDGKRTVTVNNQSRSWTGEFQGKEEKVPARKEFLKNIAEREAARTCGSAGYQPDNGPSFNMQDRSPEVYGGGLIGVLIAEAASSYENIPISIYYTFSCNDEKGLKELPKR